MRERQNLVNPPAIRPTLEDKSEIVTSVDSLSGNENEGAEGNVRSLLGKEWEQGMEFRAVVTDSLYDSSENRKAIHEEKT